MAVKQDINVGLLVFIGLVGTMLLLIAVWGVEGWYAYEVDLLNSSRYEIDRNEQWLGRRNEQYANIGDDVGNSTIYATPDPDAAPAGAGYRFLTRERDVAVIPIHEAMAQIASQYGGEQVSAEEIRQLDRAHVPILNDAYEEYMTPVEAQQSRESAAADAQRRSGGVPPTTRPAGQAPATPPAAQP